MNEQEAGFSNRQSDYTLFAYQVLKSPRENPRRLRGVFLPDTADGIRRASPKWMFALALILGTIPFSLNAQDGSDATYFWGTSSSASSSPLGSSLMHTNNGLAAGQVNAALDGILYQGSSISVVSIGSQTVVSTTVIGDDNDVSIDADQNAENSGDVSNDGTVEVVTNESED